MIVLSFTCMLMSTFLAVKYMNHSDLFAINAIAALMNFFAIIFLLL